MAETPDRRGPGARLNGTAKWIGAGTLLALALVGFIVQWGIVTTKLDQVERRLDDLVAELRGLRQEYQSIERRVSFLEGAHERARLGDRG